MPLPAASPSLRLCQMKMLYQVISRVPPAGDILPFWKKDYFILNFYPNTICLEMTQLLLMKAYNLKKKT